MGYMQIFIFTLNNPLNFSNNKGIFIKSTGRQDIKFLFNYEYDILLESIFTFFLNCSFIYMKGRVKETKSSPMR